MGLVEVEFNLIDSELCCTAVDGKLAAGNVRGISGGQEQDRLGTLFGPAKSFHGHCINRLLFHLLGHCDQANKVFMPLQ
jgi:hypothetical protein